MWFNVVFLISVATLATVEGYQNEFNAVSVMTDPKHSKHFKRLKEDVAVSCSS